MTVEFNPYGEDIKALERRMKQTVRMGINEGILTGDSGAFVERYALEVKQIPNKDPKEFVLTPPVKPAI
jgi:hypothetical protein